MYRKIHRISGDYRETPIFEITDTKTTVKGSEINRTSNPTCGLDRNEIIRIKNGVNIGLASQEILTLLNMYEVVVLMEEKYNKNTNEYLEATILKVEIENSLRKEVITGYKKYHRSLGLKKVSQSRLWKLTEDNIIYTYTVDEKQKKILRNNIKNNPDKY